MKNAIRISVEKPCSEKFENFRKTAAGGFCGSCQMEVIDFTEMTSKELVKYLSNSSDKTCGRFQVSQLKTHEPMVSSKSNSSFVSRGLIAMSFSLLSLCALSNLQAQEVANNETPMQIESNILGRTIVMGENAVEQYTVTGIVLDEENLPLGGVNVVLKGTKEGTVTDFDGTFEFPRTLDVGETLVFSYLGYDSKEYTVVESESEVIEITISFDASDIILMGAVEVEGVYTSKRNIFQKFAGLFKK